MLKAGRFPSVESVATSFFEVHATHTLQAPVLKSCPQFVSRKLPNFYESSLKHHFEESILDVVYKSDLSLSVTPPLSENKPES